jgi:hypothetical protein
VSTVLRIMSGNCIALSHLSILKIYRFRIVEEALCLCLKDYETVDHLIWHCKRYGTAKDVQLGILVRDLCALKKWGDEVLPGFPRKSWN